MTEGYKPKSLDFGDIHKVVNGVGNYSMSTFLNEYRKQDNYEGAIDVIALDIDGGWALEKAAGLLTAVGRHAMISTTKSHQIDKNGEVDDRFRILLLLEKTIRLNTVEFKALGKRVLKLFRGKADPACNDPARFFYGNPKGEYWYFKGERGWIPGDFPAIKGPRPAQFSQGSSSDGTFLGRRIEGVKDVARQKATPGQRNQYMYWLWKMLKEDLGLSDSEVGKHMEEVNNSLSVPLDARELQLASRRAFTASS